MGEKALMYLYYYTNVETMRCILKGADIYATNLQYMNDSEEYANGLKELRVIFNKNYELWKKQQLENQIESDKSILIDEEKLQKELEREVSVYSISFSESRDLLSQWSMYAGESGVSLKLKFENNETYMTYFEKNEDGAKNLKPINDENFANRKYQPEKVFYCTKDAMKDTDYDVAEKEIWEKICKNENKNTVNDLEGNYTQLWKRYAPYVKRVEFKAEKEHRLVFDRMEIPYGKNVRIDYRNSGNVLKSYMDIVCKNGWPIHEIIVEPGFNQDAVYRSILFFLNNDTTLKAGKLDNEVFFRRCEEYFEVCGKLPEKLLAIWENKKDKFKCKNLEEAYMLWNMIYEDMKQSMKKENLVWYNKLNNTVLTSKGIILSKSRIPYIY